MRSWCCKLRFLKLFIPVLFLFLTPVYSGTGLDSFAFLKIKSGARGSSLGDGFVSVAGDVNAAFFNPASIATLESFQLSLMHLAYIADTSYEFVTLAAPLNKNLSLGISVTYFSYGSIAATSESSTGVYSGTSGSFTPYDILGAVTLGYKFNKNLNFGLNVKYAMEDISGVSIGSLLADAGVLLSGEVFGAGVSLANLGSEIKDDKAPLCLRGGVSMKTELLADKDLSILLGGNYGVNSQKVSGSAGVEYCYDNMLSLRGSYSLNTDADNLSAGIGFKSSLDDLVYSFDYNFNMLGDLGNAHRISLTVSFNNKPGAGKSSRNKSRSTGIKYSIPTRSR